MKPEAAINTINAGRLELLAACWFGRKHEEDDTDRQGVVRRTRFSMWRGKLYLIGRREVSRPMPGADLPWGEACEAPQTAPPEPIRDAGYKLQPHHIAALERAAQSRDVEAQRLSELGGYSAEFPAEDAKALREVLAFLRGWA